jgi:hypothetical protein
MTRKPHEQKQIETARDELVSWLRSRGILCDVGICTDGYEVIEAVSPLSETQESRVRTVYASAPVKESDVFEFLDKTYRGYVFIGIHPHQPNGQCELYIKCGDLSDLRKLDMVRVLMARARELIESINP